MECEQRHIKRLRSFVWLGLNILAPDKNLYFILMLLRRERREACFKTTANEHKDILDYARAQLNRSRRGIPWRSLVGLVSLNVWSCSIVPPISRGIPIDHHRVAGSERSGSGAKPDDSLRNFPGLAEAERGFLRRSNRSNTKFQHDLQHRTNRPACAKSSTTVAMVYDAILPFRIRSIQTARTMSAPIAISSVKTSIPKRFPPLPMVVIIISPTTEPITNPCAPLRLAPPITAAAIAYSS